MIDGLDTESRAALDEAKLLLKLYGIEGKVDWWPHIYRGHGRNLRSRPFVLRYGPKRFVGYRHASIPSMRESFAHVVSFKTAASLLRAAKKIATATNV